MELFLKLDERLLRDDKIRDLIKAQGYEGLGIYISLLTLIRNYSDHAYQIPLEKIADIASWDLHLTEEKLNAVLDSCLEIGLLKRTDETIWSPRRKRDLLAAEEQKKKQSEGGSKAMKKRWNVSNE